MIAAASAAQHQDSEVTVYEEHGKVGSPERCGGLLSKTAIDWFDSIGVRTGKSIINHINTAVLHAGGTSAKANVDACVVRRSLFDQVCADLAERKGAKIQTGRKLEEMEIRGLACSPQSSVIGADGPFSTTAAAFGFPNLGSIAVVFQADVRCMSVDPHEFNAYFFSNSFGWTIPLDEETARAGIAFFKPQHPQNSKVVFDEFLRRITADFGGKAVSGSFFADCVPYSVRSQIQKGNVCLVGDAAGQVKATSLGGIYYGCRSAWIAGESVAEGDYAARWMMELKKDLSLHGAARSLMNSNAAVAVLLLTMRTIERLGLHLKYDMEKLSSFSLGRRR